MIGYKDINNLVIRLREELDLNDVQDTDNNRDLKLAVARALSVNLTPHEILALGIDPSQEEDVILYDEDWVSNWAHLVLGRKYPAWFAKALSENKVRLISESGTMPDGFGRLEVPVVPIPTDPKLFYIVGDDADIDPGLPINTVNPHELAEQLVAETNPGPEQVFAYLRLLGFTTPEKGDKNHGKTWVYTYGYNQYLEVRITSKGLSLMNKRLKPWLFLAGDIVGNPVAETPELPWKVLFWTLSYALSGDSNQKIAGRLRHLTEATVDDSEGAVVEGAARVKLENTLGLLGVYATWDGRIAVCNAESAVAEGRNKKHPLRDALTVLNNREIPWSLHHQGRKIYVGPGAQVLGQSVYTNTDGKRVSRFVMRIDKATKVFARIALAFGKATCQAKTVEIPVSDNQYV